MIYIGKFDLEWNVIRYNINTRKIEPFNIFDHCSFREDIETLLNETNISKEGFVEKIKSSLMYHFWSRSEYEVVIHPWIGDDNAAIKVDIYWQIRMNWDRFIDYLWSVNPK